MSFIRDQFGRSVERHVEDALGMEHNISRSRWMTNFVFHAVIAAAAGIGYLIIMWHGSQIFEAAKKGDTIKVKNILMTSPESVSKKDRQGRTPLHLAALAGRAETVKALISKGAPIAEKDSKGRTPLHCAVDFGSPETVTALVEAGADPNVTDGVGNTPLSMAATPEKSGLKKLLTPKKK